MNSPEKASYAELLCGVKSRVHAARVRAGLAANRELILLYWDIGKLVAERQAEEGWGGAVIDRLSADICREFPGLKGFSSRNILRMKTFYIVYKERIINPPQAAAKIESLNKEDLPDIFRILWFHNVILLEKVKDPAAREWYVRQHILKLKRMEVENLSA